jgi:GNAT superfamily N-acetyltransferase
VQLSADIATESDAAAIASLRTDAAEDLTRLYGRGHWSFGATEKGVVRGIATSKVLVARTNGRIVGTLRLATKKPWAIDAKYFASVRCPLYLIDMAVEPRLQRQGVGRYLLDEARLAARAWSGDAIRLDAYDAPAGAGGFYARCGFQEVGRVSYRGVPLIYFEWLPDSER